MPTYNKADLLDCAAGFHDFSDDAGECHVCGHEQARASVPADPVRDAALAALVELNDALDDGLCNSGAPSFDSNRLDRAQVAARAIIAKAEGR